MVKTRYEAKILYPARIDGGNVLRFNERKNYRKKIEELVGKYGKVLVQFVNHNPERIDYSVPRVERQPNPLKANIKNNKGKVIWDRTAVDIFMNPGGYGINPEGYI